MNYTYVDLADKKILLDGTDFLSFSGWYRGNLSSVDRALRVCRQNAEECKTAIGPEFYMPDDIWVNYMYNPSEYPDGRFVFWDRFLRLLFFVSSDGVKHKCTLVAFDDSSFDQLREFREIDNNLCANILQSSASVEEVMAALEICLL